jgi:cytochrome P450
MALRKRCSENEDDADKVRKLVEEMCELAGKGNVSEMIWFCKNLDLQGFGKRLKDVRDRYDTMMEKIMKEHEEARKKKELKDDGIKDVLDILLDIYEDENSEIKMTRENIKGFIMVKFSLTRKYEQTNEKNTHFYLDLKIFFLFFFSFYPTTST